MRLKLLIILSLWMLSASGVYAQSEKIVVLKLDDVHYGENGRAVPERWDRVADYLENKEIKAGFGIIGYSLAEDNEAYFDWIKKRAASGNIEFWNHGYYNRTGKDSVGEFERDYDSQYRALWLTDSLARAKLGLELTVWGRHWSATNEDTDRALSNMPSIKMTFGTPVEPIYYRGYVFGTNIHMEHPVHNPNFAAFIEQYEGEWGELEFFYLQGHPNSWDDERWDNFVRIVEFLHSQNVRFVTPSEFLDLVSK